jgi:hypothetical protein
MTIGVWSFGWRLVVALGGAICLAGVAVIVYWPRGG